MLYPISTSNPGDEGSRIGYINDRGEVVIAPAYAAGCMCFLCVCVLVELLHSLGSRAFQRGQLVTVFIIAVYGCGQSHVAA